MENNYYKQIFSLYTGYVYEFIGVIPDGESALEYITGQFVADVNNGQLQISVTQLPKGSSYILHSFENVESSNFKQLADLSYQEPLPELAAEPAPEGEV
jgi:hypothetical protein